MSKPCNFRCQFKYSI